MLASDSRLNVLPGDPCQHVFQDGSVDVSPVSVPSPGWTSTLVTVTLTAVTPGRFGGESLIATLSEPPALEPPPPQPAAVTATRPASAATAAPRRSNNDFFVMILP